MRLVMLAAVAAIAATPALAAPNYPDSAPNYPDPGTTDSTTIVTPRQDSTMVTPPVANPNVDTQTATADAARESYYRNKLDAAKAQGKVDSAAADRDAAQDRAAADREVARDAEENR
jgi:hypothetical protein